MRLADLLKQQPQVACETDGAHIELLQARLGQRSRVNSICSSSAPESSAASSKLASEAPKLQRDARRVFKCALRTHSAASAAARRLPRAVRLTLHTLISRLSLSASALATAIANDTASCCAREWQERARCGVRTWSCSLREHAPITIHTGASSSSASAACSRARAPPTSAPGTPSNRRTPAGSACRRSA